MKSSINVNLCVPNRFIRFPLNFSLKSRGMNGLKMRPAIRQTVSKHKFSFKSEARIAELQRIRLKKKTEAKVNWAVNAYKEWRNDRLYHFNYDVGIYFADLDDLPNLTKENLEHALCRFVPEVTKVKGEGPYPGKTLYQMIVAIQKFLNINKLNWKLIDSNEFSDLRVVLDNVMQERTAMNVGVTKRQAQVISYETEQELWDKGFLGEDTPDKLRNTTLFLIGINVYLRAIEEHYYLRRPSKDEVSQITFERDSNGVRCLVYREDTITKTHDGGIKDMKRERKIVWVYPSADPKRCPVRIVEKYMSLCPAVTGKKNFYLKSLTKPRLTQWFGNQVVGQNTLASVVKVLMEEAGIEGFFTNHSLRRTGGTRLFQAGVERKIIKEATGHQSDAIDAYQVTSNEQRKRLSDIIVKPPCATVSSNVEQVEIVEKNDNKLEENRSEVTVNCEQVSACQCGKKLNVDNVSQIISEVFKNANQNGKTVIKLQIEIIKE